MSFFVKKKLKIDILNHLALYQELNNLKIVDILTFKPIQSM